MKKIFLAVAILFVVGTVFSSCHTSRKSGCPMTEKIIRG
jgi:predicted small secreted protein